MNMNQLKKIDKNQIPVDRSAISRWRVWLIIIQNGAANEKVTTITDNGAKGSSLVFIQSLQVVRITPSLYNKTIKHTLIREKHKIMKNLLLKSCLDLKKEI